MMSDPTQGTSIAPPDPAVLRVIRPSAGGLPQPEDGEPELESAAALLDEGDDEDTGYGQIMVSMTRTVRRDPPPYPE